MSFVTTQPEMLSMAAGDLASIGSAFTAQNAAAVAPTTGLVPAAADEVSAVTAAQFATTARRSTTRVVRAVPVRRLAHTAAQWIERCGGQVGYPDDTAETLTQPDNHDPRVWKAAQVAEKALSLGRSVRPTVAAELHVSPSTVDRLLKRAKAEGWFDGQPLPKRPPPQQRDDTTTDDPTTTTEDDQ